MTVHVIASPIVSNPLASPTLDALEFARGVLSATTFGATNAAHETHVSKLLTMFQKAGFAASMMGALETMQFLREAESLGDGYWIPAPMRAVEIGHDCRLLVGPHPTSELKRHFASVRRAGAGRVMNGANSVALLRQSKAAWQGSDGNDARAWTQSIINSAMKQLAPSVIADSMQVFVVQQAGGRRREPAWVSAGSSPACEWRGVGLFRARTGATRYRYFLGKHEAGREFLEGPAVFDAARVQCGLAALQSRSLTITITPITGTTSISLPVAPPRSVRRLLVALCEVDPRSFGRVWTCCVPAYVPILLEALQELNCETKHHE